MIIIDEMLFIYLSPVMTDKNKKILIKSILSLIALGIILVVSYVLVIIFLFEGRSFYITLTTIVAIVLLILVPVSIFKLFPYKFRISIWLILLLGIIGAVGFNEYREAQDKKILRIADHGFDLSEYTPFSKELTGTKNKTVQLDDNSTLKLETNLPILDGATALYPIYSAFAQAVYPVKEYSLYDSEVQCSNTILAYNRLFEKSVDIIFVAKPSVAQIKKVNEDNIKLNLIPIGKEAFVFFVNIHNPVDNLTISQIQEIYSGKITNWKEVGGKDEKIKAFQRNEDSGSQTTFQYFMGDKPIMPPLTEDVVGDMGGIISQTADYANYSNAIGFSFRFFAIEMVKNNQIKLLKINNIYPSIETIKDNSYPITGEFYAITLADNKKGNVKKFLDWIKSGQGQKLIEKTGYAPYRK